MPNWKARAASSITTGDAIEALDGIKADKSAVAANRTLAYARAAYGWAVKRQRLPTNPLKGIERPGREISRERALSADELGAIWRACDELGGTLSGFVRVLMLTMQLREEVASMQWSELDDAKAPTTWVLPRERAKNGRTHVVHLSEPAREIIASLPRISGHPFVFAGKGNKPIAAFNYAKSELVDALDEAGEDLGDWRFHDFR